MAPSRPYQLVVWGATGFVGELVCEHIASNYQDVVSWAMAGRNAEKLEGARARISTINDKCVDVPFIVANSGDQASVDSMVAQADMIIACAGLFAQASTSVVDACVRLGTHYCDITGEALWVREMIEAHHEEALKKGVKIVHCCGCDCVAPDLGTLLVVNHIHNILKKNCQKVEIFLGEIKGGISGGTVLTILDMFSGLTNQDWKVLVDPYSLVPQDRRLGEDKAAPVFPAYSKSAGSWYSPFLAEYVDSRIIRRSNTLFEKPYGESLSVVMGTKSPGYCTALRSSFGIISVGVGLRSGCARALARKYLPKPGEGPSKEDMVNGSFKFHFFAETEESEGATPTIVKAEFSAKGYDPGYWGTARMVLECALCQVLDHAKLKQTQSLTGGVLTPATAFGMVAIERLRHAGFFIDIVQE